MVDYRWVLFISTLIKQCIEGVRTDGSWDTDAESTCKPQTLNLVCHNVHNIAHNNRKNSPIAITEHRQFSMQLLVQFSSR